MIAAMTARQPINFGLLWPVVFFSAAMVLTGETESPSTADRNALRQAATTFCTELRRERISGLPTEKQMEALGPLMTAGLRAAIGRARELQSKQMREAPEDKPDWIEGDLFSSLFEGVTSWEVGDVFTAPAVEGQVKVRQSYTDEGQPPVHWTDTLVFQKDGGKWLLDNIRLGGEWQFKTGASLRDSLPGGGKESADHESPDGRWQVAFAHEGEDVTRVTIKESGASGEPQVLFGGDDKVCPMPTWVVWNPGGDMFALRLGDEPRFTRTIIFRRSGSGWQPVELPVFYPDERKTMELNGFQERDNLVDAEHWHDEQTLVVRFFTSYTKGDEGDGFSKLVRVRVEASGQAKVIGAVDTPAED
jgi:hypothetical protein